MKRIIVLGLVLLMTLYSCEDIISIPDISEDQVTILAPAEGIILEDTSVTFSWEELEFADQYQLQVATPNFVTTGQLVVDTILGDSTQTFRNFTTTLESNMYQWRIRALNEGFQTPYTTSSFSIATTAITPLSEQTVVLSTPEDGFETTDNLITFSWEALEDASLYRVIITDLADDSTFLEEAITDTTIDITFLETGNYAWAVRAENESQNTVFSSRTLTILE